MNLIFYFYCYFIIIHTSGYILYNQKKFTSFNKWMVSSKEIKTEKINGFILSNLLNELKTKQYDEYLIQNKLSNISNQLSDPKFLVDHLFMTPYEVGKAFLGLQYIDISKHQNIHSIMTVLTNSLFHSLISEPDIRTVTNVIFGLRSSASCTMTTKVFLVVNECINKNPKILNEIDMKSISMMFRGLKDVIHNCSIEVDTFIKLLVDSIEQRSEIDSTLFIFQNGEEMASAITILTHLDGSRDIDKRLTKIIANFFEPSKAFVKKALSMNIMNVQERHIATSLHSLQSILPENLQNATNKSNYYGRCLYRIVEGICDSIMTYNEQLSSTSVGISLYGLQNIRADDPAVRRLLLTLSTKMDRTSKEYTGQLIAMSCYGLKSLGSKIFIESRSNQDSFTIPSEINSESSTQEDKKWITPHEVKKIVNALAQVIEISVHNMTPSQLSIAVFGLQQLSADSSAVRRLVSALANKFLLPSSNINKNRDISRFSNKNTLTAKEISMILQGLRNMGSEWPQVRDMLFVIYELINRSDALMNARELVTSFYSLNSMGGNDRSFSSSSINRTITESLNFHTIATQHGTQSGGRRRYKLPEELRSLLIALESKLSHRAQKLSLNDIGTSLYGFQGITAEDNIVKGILEIFADDCQDAIMEGLVIDSKSISNALYGLQNMTAKSKSVRRLLTVLGIAVMKSPYALTGQGTGNSLYGLQNMNSDVPEVRYMLKSLTQKLWCSPWTPAELSISKNNEDQKSYYERVYMLSGQNIGNALWGLRNMTSGHQEVCDLLRVLALRIQKSNADMSGQNLGNALYALHSMSNKDMDGVVIEEVNEVIIALAQKLVTSSAELSSLDIGMSLYGLRCMDTSVPAVRALMGALIVKIRASPSQMHLSELMTALVGLLKIPNNMRDEFLRLLAQKIPGMVYAG